jgi:hypothetical protein
VSDPAPSVRKAPAATPECGQNVGDIGSCLTLDQSTFAPKSKLAVLPEFHVTVTALAFVDEAGLTFVAKMPPLTKSATATMVAFAALLMIPHLK